MKMLECFDPVIALLRIIQKKKKKTNLFLANVIFNPENWEEKAPQYPATWLEFWPPTSCLTSGKPPLLWVRFLLCGMEGMVSSPWSDCKAPGTQPTAP